MNFIKRNEPSINWAKTYYYAVIFMRNSHFVDGLFSFASSRRTHRLLRLNDCYRGSGAVMVVVMRHDEVNIVIRTTEKFNGFIGSDGIIQNIVCRQAHPCYEWIFAFFSFA